MNTSFTVNSYWGPRQEGPGQIAARCRALLKSLGRISPDFVDWNFVGRVPSPINRPYDGPAAVAEFLRDQYRTVAFASMSSDDLSRLIGAAVSRADNDEPTPVSGYFFSAFTGSGREPGSLSLTVHAGDCCPNNCYINSVRIETRALCVENQSLLTLPVLKAAMLAIVETWDVTWASVYPAALAALWPEVHTQQRPTFNSAWITYLSPRFAWLITPPRSVIVEHTPKSGLVITATDERFDVGNPAHLAAAREIEVALAPVNASSWPPDGELGSTPEKQPTSKRDST